MNILELATYAGIHNSQASVACRQPWLFHNCAGKLLVIIEREASNAKYVRFRGIWAAIFVVNSVYDQIYLNLELPGLGFTYYFFLTHQARLVQTFGQIAEWRCAMSVCKGTVPSQCMSKLALLCFAVGQPISLLVTVGYWVLIWRDIQTGEKEVGYVTVFNHGINGLFLFISFMISRMPYSCSYGGWVILAGLLYVAFTYVHFLLHLGSIEKCQYDDQRDCPIYAVFDWHKPERTGVLGLLGVAVLLLVVGLYIGLASLRNRCASSFKSSQSSANSAPRGEGPLPITEYHEKS
eukprot:s1015_g5.t4